MPGALTGSRRHVVREQDEPDAVELVDLLPNAVAFDSEHARFEVLKALGHPPRHSTLSTPTRTAAVAASQPVS